MLSIISQEKCKSKLQWNSTLYSLKYYRYWQECGKIRMHCWQDCKNGTITLDYSLALPKSVKQLSCNSDIPLLGMYPRDMKTYIHMKDCIWVFIIVLFIIAKMW